MTGEKAFSYSRLLSTAGSKKKSLTTKTQTSMTFQVATKDENTQEGRGMAFSYETIVNHNGGHHAPNEAYRHSDRFAPDLLWA